MFCTCSGEAKAGTESGENALRDKLFQNITIPEEGASVAKEVSSAATKSENSPPAQGLVSFVGNALLYGFLGTGAFVGYYQYRYSADEVENMVKESEKAGDGSFSVCSLFECSTVHDHEYHCQLFLADLELCDATLR